MENEIFRNLPGNTAWEDSFYEQLTEYGVWNVSEFWKLHFALVQAASTGSSEFISRELALAVSTLQTKVSNLISSHYDLNDSHKINNLTPGELYAFRERFEHAALSVFSGKVISENSYDLVNPLMGSK